MLYPFSGPPFERVVVVFLACMGARLLTSCAMWGIEFMRGHRRGEHGARIGRLVVHVISNGEGAPLLDDAWLMTEDGRRFGGKCVSLVRRRNRHGERLGGHAVFVGWRQRVRVGDLVAYGGMEPSGG